MYLSSTIQALRSKAASKAASKAYKRSKYIIIPFFLFLFYPPYTFYKESGEREKKREYKKRKCIWGRFVHFSSNPLRSAPILLSHIVLLVNCRSKMISKTSTLTGRQSCCRGFFDLSPSRKPLLCLTAEGGAK